MLRNKFISSAAVGILLCSIGSGVRAAGQLSVYETCKQIELAGKPLDRILYGVFDHDLRWIVQPEYEYISEIASGYFLAKKLESKFAVLIDTTQSPLKEYPIDENLSTFADPRQQQCRFLWLNYPGHKLNDPRKSLVYQELVGDKYCLKTALGQTLIKAGYDGFTVSDDGTIVAGRYNKLQTEMTLTIFDAFGHARNSIPKVSSAMDTFRHGLMVVSGPPFNNRSGKVGIVNTQGRFIYPQELDSALVCNGFVYAENFEKGATQHFLIDSEGHVFSKIADEKLAAKVYAEQLASQQAKLAEPPSDRIYKIVDDYNSAVVDAAQRYVLPPSRVSLQACRSGNFICGLLGPRSQKFYPASWKKESDCSRSFAAFLHDYDLIGMSKAELIKHLGEPDKNEDRSVLSYFRMNGYGVEIRLLDDTVVAWRLVYSDVKEAWIEKNVMIPITPHNFLTNVHYAVAKVPGADFPKGKQYPIPDNE